MLSSRTIISLAQLLSQQPHDVLPVLFEKCSVTPATYTNPEEAPLEMKFIRDTLANAGADRVMDLLNEALRLAGSYRVNAPVKWRYQQHWDDLCRCLMMDGYLVRGSYNTQYELVAVDPTIEASAPVEDDLTSELDRSNLARVGEVKRLMDNSARDFRGQPPNFNGSMTSARIALETIAKDIAFERQKAHPGNFDQGKWGSVITYLRTSGLITKREEEGLVGVYSFISEGAHTAVGMTEEEMIRLSRSLAASMSYFLVRRYSG